MFCGECGSKVNKDDLFCAECGNQLQEPKQVKNKTPMNKRTKVTIGIIGFIVLALVLGMFLLSSLNSPKMIARTYMEAIDDKNANKLYSLLEIEGDKTFVGKRLFKEIIDEYEDEIDIENYSITDVTYGMGNLTAIVTITYIEDDSTKEQTMKLQLKKGKNKKWLLFDDWKLADSDFNSIVLENFKITVPKNSKVTFAGINIENKYLNKEQSTEQLDVYVLNQVFTAKTKIEVTLPSGYIIKDEITPSGFKNYYTAQVSLNNIEKEEQDVISEQIKKDLTTIYNGALANKSFADIKSELSIGTNRDKEIEEEYKEFIKELNESSNQLTKIEFTNIILSSVKMDDDGYLEYRVKVNYDYGIKYKDFTGTEKTKDSSSSSYMTFSYNSNGSKYMLMDIDDLEDYFSRY